MATGKSLAQFREKHDPTFTVEQPKPFKRKLRKGCKTFVIVAAQNGTPVEPDWWKCILKLAEHRKAELLVVPVRYKNPTSQWTASQDNAEWWAPETAPFLWSARLNLGPKLTVLGDFKIQPTASDPLTGAEALSLEQSGIIGHTKLHMRSIPTPASRMAKILTTTGACTVENYTDSRAGRIAAFHHSLSCVVVECEGKRFHLRHVHYDRKTKSATDLTVRYNADMGRTQAPRPLALVMGDTHVRVMCPKVQLATFGTQGMVNVLKPQHLIWHDVLDAQSCTPHHVGDPFMAVAKHKGRASDVEREVRDAIDFILNHTPPGTQSVVVGSNHNDMLGRWLKRADWRSDPENAAFYLHVAALMVDSAGMTGAGGRYADPFSLLVRQRKAANVRVLDEDESFMLGGVELGMHGNRGLNGSRGSIRNLRRIGVKSIIGHSHSPGIDEGCYQTGTSTHLRLDYNHGASSWLNAHAVLHADGKRQIIVIVDGHWRA